MVERCTWATADPLYIRYHDEEWGTPVRDDAKLFEFLLLEGAQAGLSWITILRKRENFRSALDDFCAEKIARYDDNKVTALLQDAGIIRNKLKINAFILNAQAYLRMQEAHGSFSAYIWSFVDGEPVVNHFSAGEVPSRSVVSDRMSVDLKKNGFKFVGSTICYAYMQATGMVMDHTINCFRHKELSQATSSAGK